MKTYMCWYAQTLIELRVPLASSLTVIETRHYSVGSYVFMSLVAHSLLNSCCCVLKQLQCKLQVELLVHSLEGMFALAAPPHTLKSYLSDCAVHLSMVHLLF